MENLSHENPEQIAIGERACYSEFPQGGQPGARVSGLISLEEFVYIGSVLECCIACLQSSIYFISLKVQKGLFTFEVDTVGCVALWHDYLTLLGVL